MQTLLADPDCRIDGFLCPGHVSVVLGSETYRPVVDEFEKPCVVAGFEPLMIMRGILHLARQAAAAFYERLREMFDAGESITTFGPYSPGQAVAIKRAGIEGIYLGGWATSAKGSIKEDLPSISLL